MEVVFFCLRNTFIDKLVHVRNGPNNGPRSTIILNHDQCTAVFEVPMGPSMVSLIHLAAINIHQLTISIAQENVTKSVISHTLSQT